MPVWRVLLACLLLVGLAACAGLPRPENAGDEQKEVSVTAPGGEADGQDLALAGELPEPQAENPQPALSGQPASGGAAEPALSGEPAFGGEPALGGVEPALSGESTPGGEAALPVPRPPAEPKKAPAKKAAAASKPAKEAKTPQASTPKAAAAKPGTAAKPATSDTVAEDRLQQPVAREVLARKGDTVVIDLEGRGWLLLPGDRRGISFTGSESGPQRTSFSFKALELGEYELAFQLQDNTRGAATGEVVRLRVLPEEKLREMLAAPPIAGFAPLKAGSTATESLDPARLQKAENLFAGGFYDLALPEYLAIYREGDPLLNDRLAAIYLQTGDAAAAAKFYDRNLYAAVPYARKAVVGLVRAGLAMASPELVLQQLPALLELPPAETERELLGVAHFAASQGRHPLALELLTEYLRRYPRGAGLGAAYFQLARLFEVESPLRDVRLAREYYRKVYEEFPESEHAAEAHTRILYLDRHFFHVQ